MGREEGAVDSKAGGGSGLTASEDKGMQSCDWRGVFGGTQGATCNNHCTSPVTKYSKLLQITIFNFPSNMKLPNSFCVCSGKTEKRARKVLQCGINKVFLYPFR